MTLSALSKKIEKVENEINKHQEIISDKKKELAELKKQQRTLQLQEKQKRGENFISTLEECSINFLRWQMKVQQFHMKTKLKLFMKV